MIRLAQQEIHFGRHVSMEEILSRIDGVSAQDLLALSRRLFGDDRVALTTLGPIADESLFSGLMKR